MKFIRSIAVPRPVPMAFAGGDERRPKGVMPHEIFVPQGLVGLAPLIVALHGCGQSTADFAAGTRLNEVAERYGAIVVYPEQTKTANTSGCWNWFLPEHQTRTGGEPAAILRLMDFVAQQHAIDRTRIYVTGLSAGGSMAAILAEQAPEIFAGVGIVAGVALHASHDIPSAFAAMAGKQTTTGTRARSTVLPVNGGVPTPALHPLVAQLAAKSSLPLGNLRLPGAAGGAAVSERPAPLQHASDNPAAVRSTSGDFGRMRVMVWTGTNDSTVSPTNATALVHQFATLLGLDVAQVETSAHGTNAHVARLRDAGGIRIESWTVRDMGHAWSGGSPRGSYTYPAGPNTSDVMLDFFLAP